MTQQTDKHDVIIIGGGVIGVCSAYYLQQAGYKVALLEKGQLAAGSSWGNAGLIVPSHFTPLAAPGVIWQGLRWMLNPESPFYIKPRLDPALLNWLWKFRGACTQSHVERAMPLLRDMHLAGVNLYQELAALAELDFGFQRCGLLMLFKYENGQHECEELVEVARQLGLNAEMLDKSRLEAKITGIDVKAKGGAYFAQDAHLNPADFVQQMGQYLSQNGVDILTQTEVTGLETSNSKVTSVLTSTGEYRADEIVLAGGVWSPGIVRALNLKLPVQAAKGYSFDVPQLAGSLDMPLMLSDAKVAVTPLQNGMRFAGTLEMAGIDLSINPRRVQAIRRAIPQYLGGVNPAHLEQPEVWAGLRPCTPDGLPVIGRATRFDNLTLATGHAMLGVSLAPVTGKLVTEVISGETPSVDMSILSAGRFG